MRARIPAVIALAAQLSGGLAHGAEESDARPTFHPDGSVGVPAFQLPPSSYMSDEAVGVLKARAANPVSVEEFGSTIEERRAAVERQLAPAVEAAKRRYPVQIAPREIAGVKTHVITPEAGEADAKRVLINLHGGGFSMCAQGCALVESIPIAAVGRFKVVTVDYRQGPEHRFPAATEDVVAVYRELLESYAAERVGIYGCSAGGALTGQVGAWIAEKGLPKPGALGIFGAGATRFGTGDSAYVAAYIDGSFPAPGPDGGPVIPMEYFSGSDLASPLISPAGHLEVLAQFPPTLLITGTRAMDLSPAIHTHSQLLKAGVRSELVVGEGMGHCYIYFSDVPEARDAYDVIVRFFGEHLGG